jgi:uncharacterized RDD family membrane protein YckC
MNSVYYPRLVRRVRAVLIDSVLVPVAAIATLLIGVSVGITSPLAKVALFIGPVILLEPVMVMLTGGTIGHHLTRLKVLKKDGTGYLGFIPATVRFLIKLFLGWFSFIFILTTQKHQAVHDIAAGSIVVHRDVTNLPAYEVLAERKADTEYDYPPVWKRFVFIILYSFVMLIVASETIALLVANVCLYAHRCSLFDQVVLISFDICLLLSIGGIIVLGWKGALLGCRKISKKIESQL